MLKIAVCDDCKKTLVQIKEKVDSWKIENHTIICETFENSTDLIISHRNAPFDIILLDIVMPAPDGIETAREIRKNDKTVKIVFLTSSPEYAVESYTVKADNYLLKPVKSEKLISCLDELAETIFIHLPAIAVKTGYSVQKIVLRDIEYVEAQNKNIVFYLTDGTQFCSTEPLHTFDDRLSVQDGFFKCHRSYIVNINRIDRYTSKEIKMRSGVIIPISRGSHKDFETAYFSVIFGKDGDMQ